jgi:hypothetical protein
MKIMLMVPREIDIKSIRATIPYDAEDREGPGAQEIPWEALGKGPGPGTLTIEFDVDERRLVGWPSGKTRARFKVRDEGTYEVIDRAGTVISKTSDCYAPACLPGTGDYLIVQTDAEGRVLQMGGGEWRPTREYFNDFGWGSGC